MIAVIIIIIIIYVLTVTGKEFRAVFISTVRTFLTCQNFHGRGGFVAEQQSHWEFLSDSTLLNTAITRAKSLVAVVGEPVSLCTVGECRENWRDYITRCHDRKAFYGTAEQKKLISASLSRILLNPAAHDFIPKSTTNIYEQDKERGNALNFELEAYRENQDNFQVPAQDKEMHPPNTQMADRNVIDGTSTADEHKQEEPKGNVSDSSNNETSSQDVKINEFNSTSQSTEIEEVEEENEILDKFRREILKDETGFPKFVDNIIRVLLEKCKEKREEDACHQGSSHFFRSSKAVKTSQTRFKTESHSKNPTMGDYTIRTINGREEFQLLDLGFTRAPSSCEKPVTNSSLQPNFLKPETLRSVLLDNPEKYLPCTLRLNAESISSAYAMVWDTKTPDIKIKGPIRGVFDMDRVVVEKKKYQPLVTGDVLHFQGKIVGKFAAGLSQSVERLTSEREVVGSIPGPGPTLRVLK